MDVVVLTVGDLEAGSTKFRIAQYQKALKQAGVALSFVQRNAIDDSTIDLAAGADVVLNQKCVFDNALAKRIIRVAKRVVFDFDDAVYTRSGKSYSLPTQMRINRRLHLWLREADAVVAANRVLGDYARQHSDRVTEIPMSLDLHMWCPQGRDSDDRVGIGWAGAPVNVCNLERIGGVLKKVLERHPEAVLHVYSGSRPELPVPFEHVPFSPGTEPAFVQQLDVSLLPLVDEPHAHGKSPIKAIQSIACGVPIVGNIVGATSEILNAENSIAVVSDDEWVDGLSRLIDDAALRTRMGQAGRAHAEAHHDFDSSYVRLLAVLSGK
jgi:glycosyltransferase involved in cell wall biosynthesis